MRSPHRLGVVTLLFSCTIAAQAHAQTGRLRAIVAGSELPSALVRSVAVDSDALGVDSATVIVEVARGRVPGVGAALDVEGSGGGEPRASIFKGEIVGVEPSDAAGGSTVMVRAFNKLHRLTRGRKSRTFEKQSDADIAARIAGEAGLDFAPSGPEAASIRDYVVQHNESDLEFLRARAARIGYEVWVEDTTLYFRRRPDPMPVVVGCAPLRGPASADLLRFRPRLSSAVVVKKVTVRGWDPTKKEDIVGEATRPMIPLSAAAADLLEPPGPSLDLGVVLALETGETAYGTAHGTLAALTAADLSAEADAGGSAWLRAGAEVIVRHGERRFDGTYLVQGASHRYARDSAEGWHTLLRLLRADRGVYLLPEIGDEVLVAFEHGDIHHPYVVGSLWNDTDHAAEAPACEPGAVTQ